jgi:hypothetical protein
VPKNVEIQVFRFDELPEKVQQKLIECERQSYYDDGMIADDVRERFTDRLNERGLPTGDIRWGLGHCQGDGVAFYGEVDFKELFEKNKLAEKFPVLASQLSDIYLKIIKLGHHSYDHWNTMGLDNEYPFDWEENVVLKNEISQFLADFEVMIRDFSRDLEKEGYEIYDAYDDDYFREWLKENDIWYFADGRIHERNP